MKIRFIIKEKGKMKNKEIWIGGIIGLAVGLISSLLWPYLLFLTITLVMIFIGMFMGWLIIRKRLKLWVIGGMSGLTVGVALFNIWIIFLWPLVLLMTLIGGFIGLSIMRKKSYNPFKMWGAWIGLLIVLLIFIAPLIGTLKASNNSCRGSQSCDYNEQCSNIYTYWDPDDSWFDFSKRKGMACEQFDFFCVETQHCEQITNCSSQRYVHVQGYGKVTWHECFYVKSSIQFPDLNIYEVECEHFNMNCKVFDSDGNLLPELTTGSNPNLVNVSSYRRSPGEYILLITIFILSIIGFFIGWGIHSLIRKLKKNEN